MIRLTHLNLGNKSTECEAECDGKGNERSVDMTSAYNGGNGMKCMTSVCRKNPEVEVIEVYIPIVYGNLTVNKNIRKALHLPQYN